MASKDSKSSKASNPGATSKGGGKAAPARGSAAWARQVGQNRDDASRRAGRRTGVNWD